METSKKDALLQLLVVWEEHYIKTMNKLMILKRADEALYVAKENGKNKVIQNNKLSLL